MLFAKSAFFWPKISCSKSDKSVISLTLFVKHMLALASSCAVLIVEDNFDTAEMLRKFLKRKGIKSEAVEDGMAALEFLEHGVPQCLIVDFSLPRMDGLELLRQLKARPEYRHLPVIFYTATYDWRLQMEAEALGAAGWYIKGITSLRDLAELVLSYCKD
jgi:CheY-like chemotaxis protein